MSVLQLLWQPSALPALHGINVRLMCRGGVAASAYVDVCPKNSVGIFIMSLL